MGDSSYDEDEGRLMIDDAILDNTHSSQTGNAETSSTKTTSYEKTVELTQTSEDIQGVHRDDRLKMTIRRTQSPVGNSGQFSYMGEKHDDGATQSEDILKEEGEIDDEEETGSGVHAQPIPTNVHQSANWPGYQNAGFEASSAGTAKFRHSGQQPFEHHSMYSSPHSGVRQLAVNISASSSVTSGSATVEENSSRSVPVSHPSKTQTSPATVRLGVTGNQPSPTEAQFGEGSANMGGQNVAAEGEISENTGTSNTPSSKARKKKRRVSERDGRETCQASPSGTSPSFTVAVSPSGVAPVGVASAKKKKSSMWDSSTCVSVKSVQTNDGELDVKVGSTHCLNISVLAKASNYLYFVTNWNGHDLYGVLGDGLPPLQHTYMSKKNGGTSAASNNIPGFDLFSSHDKTNGGSPSKQRLNAKRSNRSSSVCPPNGFPEIKPAARKGLIGSVGRPSSASTSDVQLSRNLTAVGGDLQDEERSQSPVSWFTSATNDPISALASFGTGATSSSTQLRECVLSAMYSCPVAGCEHRYDTQSQLAIHYHTHFVKEDGGRAIYVETMGTQTNIIVMKDVAVETVKEQTESHAVSSEEIISSEMKNPKNDGKTPHLLSPKPKLSKTLTNHEEQSISELFKVVTQKTETGGGSAAKADDKKTFAAKSPKISASSSNAYGTLLSGSDRGNVDEMPTALDAIRKMVTDSTNDGASSREQQQSATVISSSGMLPSTSVASTTPHGGAASPAFSDISDDAPTLEKEVSDKSEERSLDRIKELVNSTKKTPLGQLSLSIENEKLGNVTKSSVGTSSLLCPVSTSTTTTATTLSVSRASTDTNQSCTSDGSKKSETKSQAQVNTIGSFASPFMDSSSFTGLRHPSTIPISIPNLSNPSSASVFAQPYFMPFIAPSVSNATTAGISQPHASKHKIHDLKANPPSLIPSQSKESGNSGQSSSVVASPSSRPLSQGGPGNVPATKQVGSQNTTTGSSFTGIQPHASGNSDRNVGVQQSPALNFMQQQQQQAYFAQLQQHQQMQYMQRFGAAFPMTGPPNSMNTVAQQAYEQQMAALHASFGFPGIFMPPSFPPK